MTEQLSQNNHPLNQQAKERLSQAGEAPQPDLMYGAQFLQWALDGRVKVAQRVEGRLREAAEYLAEWAPEKALKALVPEESERQDLPADLDQAAMLMVELLDEHLTETQPGYPEFPPEESR